MAAGSAVSYTHLSNTVKIKIPGNKVPGALREENEMKRKILAAVFLTVTATSAFTGTDLILAAEKTEETAVQKPDMEGIDTERCV